MLGGLGMWKPVSNRIDQSNCGNHTWQQFVSWVHFVIKCLQRLSWPHLRERLCRVFCCAVIETVVNSINGEWQSCPIFSTSLSCKSAAFIKWKFPCTLHKAQFKTEFWGVESVGRDLYLLREWTGKFRLCTYTEKSRGNGINLCEIWLNQDS